MVTVEWEDNQLSEIERLEQEITATNERNKRKQVYLDFLKANPLFQEFLKLKSEAN